MDLNRVRKIFRRDNGLAKYVAFKRLFALTDQGFVDNLKEKGNGTKLIIERMLLHLPRKSYNDSTPAEMWKPLYGRLPSEIL